ncbi:MAG: hypothetical protein WBB00_24230 [Mycobacterium sp.]
MGESTHIDLDRLRRLADRISAAGAEVADMGDARWDLGGLPGSLVHASVEAAPIVAEIGDISESLHQWATAARASAEVFERADAANGERFPLR